MFDNKPMIIVQGFSVTYRLGKDGKQEPVEWVQYAPAHDPTGTSTKVRVKELIPPGEMPRDEVGTKLGLMHLKWNQIKPAYDAWKKGIEIPLDGTPLAAWAGVTPEQADVLRSRGIKTIEAVRDMAESMFGKIPIPNVRALRDMAGKYLEGQTAAAAAAKLQQRDEKISAMETMMEEMAARLAVLDTKDAPVKRGPGRPKKSEPEEAEAA